MDALAIVISLICLVAGFALGYLLFRYVIKQKYQEMVKAAEAKAENIKKDKLLEVKEKFLNKKS